MSMVWNEAVDRDIYERIPTVVLLCQNRRQVQFETARHSICFASVARVEQSEKALVIPRMPKDDALIHASVVAVIPLIGHTCGSCRHDPHYSALPAAGLTCGQNLRIEFWAI